METPPICSTADLFLALPSKPYPNTTLPIATVHFPPKRTRLACAVSDYRYGAVEEERELYPRPQEIPWKKELCNSVSLIGVVGLPVEIKHLPSGKIVAWTSLAVKKSATDTSWFNLNFWDEIAHVAFRHVEKGNQIHVSGRLVSDVVESEDGKQRTYYKVVVQQLNFIEKTASMGAASDFSSGGGSMKDFVSVEESWQAFFANPLEWWDNRKTKRNPNYPDFKHKDTGEALWIDGRNNPPWVTSQLSKLDEKMGSFQNMDARWPVRVMSADELTNF